MIPRSRAAADTSSVTLGGADLALLRRAVAQVGRDYGMAYFLEQVRTGGRCQELWADLGRCGFTGVHLPEAYGGGGAGMAELCVVAEEISAHGCPLLMLMVSSAVCGTILARFGTEEQKRRRLPGIADGSAPMAFAITEADAGSNSYRIATTARPDGQGWVLSGSKIFTSGVDTAAAVMVVARTERPSGEVAPGLFIVERDAPGLSWRPVPMDVALAEVQHSVFLDEVRVPRDARVADGGHGLAPLFAGLNPERLVAASLATGLASLALHRAVDYAGGRTVWQVPLGAHQGIAHPLAKAAIDTELARLMTGKAAALCDLGQHKAAGEAANMAKYAAAEAAARVSDQVVQVFGGNGMCTEYGVAPLLALSRAIRIAPVSQEMILNHIAHSTLGLPKSY
ncbi:acyl-CoA dehydrogenase [Streptomyces sp. NRRL F-5755]|uniref:acyl-CoA dehydrogenase family protein n=1 Tax=Streptomyces sp. NRRL F-5755 TaxID=1519475 RepID=UPI0006AF3CDE|nr:acyl-CoA dehydrogenase family protein [Streptomyces sp. NRRL F-5755]KOT90257.1 acyl-CoA dehydrogenase [Streptomyces sp. NRRL F-5755]